MKNGGVIRYIDLVFLAHSEDEFPEKVHLQIAITLRGAFGIALKKLVCNNYTKKCDDCLLRNSCPYMRIFEGLAPENRKQMKLYAYIPQPFVFRLLDDSYVHNNTLKFGFRVFGESIDLYPYIIVAVKNMLERGLGKSRQKFELHSVSDGANEIYSNLSSAISTPKRKSINIVSLMDEIHNADTHKYSFKLTSQTPVHIRTAGRWNQSPTLFDLVKSALRRIKIMSYFYGNIELDTKKFSSVLFEELEVANVVSSGYDIWSFSRYSSRQKRRIPLNGVFLNMLIESATFRIIRLFEIASEMHLGKYTSFGFGQIKCEA